MSQDKFGSDDDLFPDSHTSNTNIVVSTINEWIAIAIYKNHDEITLVDALTAMWGFLLLSFIPFTVGLVFFVATGQLSLVQVQTEMTSNATASEVFLSMISGISYGLTTLSIVVFYKFGKKLRSVQ